MQSSASPASEASSFAPMAPEGVDNQDRVLPFTVDALDVRGRVVTLGSALDEILRRHAYPKPVSRLVAEALVLTALLGTALKFEGRFILQTQTDGPVPMIVADFESPDRLRAYASFDADAVDAAIAAGKDKPADLLGHGHLAMTIDQGPRMNRYQGVVVLDGASLEDVAHDYFAQSEQIPTRVRLAVGEVFTRGESGAAEQSWRAGGVLVQFLPDDPNRITVKDLPAGDDPSAVDGQSDMPVDEDDAWTEARSLVETVQDHELFDPEVTAERLLYRLFHERGVRAFQSGQLLDQCRCSREKIEGILGQFSDEERADMIEDGQIVVTCEFCSTAYLFDPEEVA